MKYKNWKNLFTDIYSPHCVVEKLEQEVKELNKRISELEKMLSVLIKPLRQVSRTTQNYMRITGLLLDQGGITPDMILPEVKDTISREIVRVLLDRYDQNISQITDLVRSKRGTASRRIIRDRVKDLEERE